MKLNSHVSNFGPKPQKLCSLNYGDVTLLDGPFQEAFEREYEYYMGISADDMLFELRKAILLDTKRATSLHYNEQLCYESEFYNGYTVLGQWLQAFARFYHATGREEAKQKALDLVDGLAEIVAINPKISNDFSIMCYFEKILRGLTDCWLLCGSEKAYEIADRLMKEAMNSNSYNKAKLFFGDHGRSRESRFSLEWYTISESMLYFADAKEREKGINSDEYRDFAKKFEYNDFWEIFESDGNDIYKYSPIRGNHQDFFHVPSHLNTFNSAAYFYQLTNDDYYLNVVDNCYNWMYKEQAISTGAYGLLNGWAMPDTGKIHALYAYHDNFDTQCGSYAVYRLSNFLIAEKGDAKYADWTERLLYNATFASLPTDKFGHVFCHSDYNVDISQKTRHRFTWVCCTGTRPLLVNELKRSIYFYNENNVYVAQYLASKTEINGAHLTIEGNYPYDSKITVKVDFDKKPESFTLNLRKPEWSKNATVLVNGNSIDAQLKDNWLTVNVDWQESNVVVLDLHNCLRVESVIAKRVGFAAIMEGPVCLASQGGIDAGAETDLDDPDNSLEKIAPLHYQHKESKTRWKPFFEYEEAEPYHLFFRVNKKNR